MTTAHREYVETKIACRQLTNAWNPHPAFGLGCQQPSWVHRRLKGRTLVAISRLTAAPLTTVPAIVGEGGVLQSLSTRLQSSIQPLVEVEVFVLVAQTLIEHTRAARSRCWALPTLLPEGQRSPWVRLASASATLAPAAGRCPRCCWRGSGARGCASPPPPPPPPSLAPPAPPAPLGSAWSSPSPAPPALPWACCDPCAYLPPASPPATAPNPNPSAQSAAHAPCPHRC
jgi:hypothetical protein